MSDPPFLRPRDAARILGISFSTLKQWIYAKKLRAVKTPGGHHRIPRAEIDRYLYRAGQPPGPARRERFRRISGRNQLVGRVVDVRVEGLLAQVKLSFGGQQITSIITSEAARELNLRRGDTAAALIKATEVMIVRV
jgi:molybdopterin-binding protein